MSGYEFIIGAFISAAQEFASAAGQAKIARHDAQVAQQNAQLAEQQAEVDAARKRREVARALGKRRASVGAAGLTVEGSPLDLLEDFAAESELEVLGIRQQGALRAREFLLGARRSGLKAETAQTKALLGAGGQLLSGTSKLLDATKQSKDFFNLSDPRPHPGDPD